MLKFKKKPTPEELAAEKQKKIADAKKEYAKIRISKEKSCKSLKNEIDKAKAERDRCKSDAITALENGDELEARRLCSVMNIHNTAIGRKTKFYLLNLKMLELIGQKEIFLETFEMSVNFELGNDLINDEDIANLQKQLEDLDLEMELTSKQIGEVTQSEETNEIFNELVNEVKRKQDLNNLGVSSDTFIPSGSHQETKHV